MNEMGGEQPCRRHDAFPGIGIGVVQSVLNNSRLQVTEATIFSLGPLCNRGKQRTVATLGEPARRTHDLLDDLTLLVRRERREEAASNARPALQPEAR